MCPICDQYCPYLRLSDSCIYAKVPSPQHGDKMFQTAVVHVAIAKWRLRARSDRTQFLSERRLIPFCSQQAISVFFFWVWVLLMHPGRLVFFRRGALNTSSWAVFDSELKSTWSHCQTVGDSSLNTSNNTPWADNHPGGAPGRDSGTSCDFCSPPPCLAYRLWTASHAQSEPELFYTEVFHSWGGYVSSHLEVKYF